MRSLNSRLCRTGILLLFVLNLAACGQDNWVKEVEADLYADQGQVWSEVNIYMFTGNIKLMAMSLPILTPDRKTELGRVSLAPVVDSDYINHVLSLLINFSALAKIPQGHNPILPNGDPLPLGGVDKNSVLALPVGGSGTMVYVHMNSSMERVSVGVAVPLEGLGNPLGQPYSFFLPAELSSNVNALFGMFFGLTSRSNGFAVFVDAMNPKAAGMMMQSQRSLLPRTSASSQLELVASDDDSASRRKIDQYMWGLHTRKATLRAR